MPTARAIWRDAHHRVLHSGPGHHHQVVELVHDDHNEGEPIESVVVDHAGIPLLPVARDITNAGIGEKLVATLHLRDGPLQSIGGLLGTRYDPGQQVGHVVVLTHLDALRIDEYQPHLLRTRSHENRCHHRVDAR